MHALRLILHLVQFNTGCRSPSKCRDTLGSFDKAKGTFEVLQLDLTCMDSVRRFAKEVIDRKRPVHSLVNNGKHFISRILTNFQKNPFHF